MDLIKPNSFKDNFSKFIVDNGIAGTAAGVSIAVTTKELVTSFVGDILIPLIYLLLIRVNANAVKFLPSHTKLNIIAFIQQFITWILIIIITFVFIQYFFNNFLGVSNKPANTEKDKEKEKESMTNQLFRRMY